MTRQGEIRLRPPVRLSFELLITLGQGAPIQIKRALYI